MRVQCKNLAKSFFDDKSDAHGKAGAKSFIVNNVLIGDPAQIKAENGREAKRKE